MKVTLSRRTNLLNLLCSKLSFNPDELWEFRKLEHQIYKLHSEEPMLYMSYVKLIVSSKMQKQKMKLFINRCSDPCVSTKTKESETSESSNRKKIGPMIICYKCGAEAKVVSIRQLRSADEPMTVTCVCTKCKKRFTIN